MTLALLISLLHRSPGLSRAPVEADHLADAAGRGVLPPAQLHPPRREAGEHLADRRWCRQAVRLRLCQDDQCVSKFIIISS